MAKTISPAQLGEAIASELTVYHKNVVEAIDEAGSRAVKNLVTRTRATAPTGARGSYKKHIAGKLLEKHRNGSTYVWYVKSPDYRLTHLLVNGHATRDGGRTMANPFLANAVAEVLPAYEKAVEEAIKNGK